MRRLLYFLLLCVACVQPFPAGAFQSATLRRQTEGVSYTLNKGDYLKVWALEPSGKLVKYKGTFSAVRDGQLFLKRKPPIPLDRIQEIWQRPKAMRIVLWSMLILGALLIEASFISFLAAFENAAAYNAAEALIYGGFGLMILYVPLLVFTMRHIEQVNTQWTIEPVVMMRIEESYPLAGVFRDNRP